MFTITHHDVGSLTLAAPTAAYLRWIVPAYVSRTAGASTGSGATWPGRRERWVRGQRTRSPDPA